MKRSLVFFSAAVLIVIAFFATSFLVFLLAKSHKNTLKSQFYVGVSYCGNTTEGAKLLIDRVKSYTNLFVISNTPISSDENLLNEVCEYAISSDLNIIVNLGTASQIDFENYSFVPIWTWQYQWLDEAKQRWDNKFLGVYYYDEPGGIQIDAPWSANASGSSFLNYDATAKFFEWVYKNDSGLVTLRDKNITSITSDYVLYWFDYLAGYDVILAELGWNQSSVQTMALVRGAATVQEKDWGIIITWKYDNPPYLDSGEAIYRQLLTAYECGAKYEVIFNYPTYPANNNYGLLFEEHFEALQRFWNDINAISPEAHSSHRAKAALVLPRNYGWGMRAPDDKIWGAWNPDEKSSQIWNISRELLAKYGFSLDIVYEDPVFSTEGVYPIIYYWNETDPLGAERR